MPVRTRPAALGAALLLGLTATPLLAAEPAPFVPDTPTTEVFLVCDGPTKEGFANGLAGLVVDGEDDYATWGPDAPASVTTGAGCGKVDEPLFGGTRPGTPFQHSIRGTYDGNLDTLTVTLHSADYGTSRTGDATELAVRATVDGLSLFGSTTNESAAGDLVASPAEVPVTVTPVSTGATGAVRAFTFSITGIDLLLPADDTEHEVVIDVSAGLDGQNWLWGAAEAPSGVVFTPETLAPAKVKAARRTTRK